MRKKFDWVWEVVNYTNGCETSRAKVIGGWLVHVVMSDSKRATSSMQFVPDRDHEWMIMTPVEAK